MSFRPVFENGLILKQHMLEALRDYPLDYVDIIFSNMGDGVISGMDIVITENNSFYVSEGIVKIDGKIYLINRSEVLKFREQENFVYLQIMTEKYIDGTSYRSEIVQKEQENESLFELFRYIKNAEMKQYYSIDEVFVKVINRIDRRRMQKSIQGGSTLCDDYYNLFAECILCRDNAQVKDIAFAYQCLNSITNANLIKEYFDTDDVSNDNILSLMKKLVDKMQIPVAEEVDRKPEQKNVRRILVN